MRIWLFIGIIILIGSLYVGIISIPEEGPVHDIPMNFKEKLEAVGNPFIITFWIAALLTALNVLQWVLGPRV